MVFSHGEDIFWQVSRRCRKCGDTHHFWGVMTPVADQPVESSELFRATHPIGFSRHYKLLSRTIYRYDSSDITHMLKYCVTPKYFTRLIALLHARGNSGGKDSFEFSDIYPFWLDHFFQNVFRPRPYKAIIGWQKRFWNFSKTKKCAPLSCVKHRSSQF
jgi:hypothetical protein